MIRDIPPNSSYGPTYDAQPPAGDQEEYDIYWDANVGGAEDAPVEHQDGVFGLTDGQRIEDFADEEVDEEVGEAGHPEGVDVCSHAAIHPNDHVDLVSSCHGLPIVSDGFTEHEQRIGDTRQRQANQVIIPPQPNLGHSGATPQPQHHGHHGQSICG